MNKIQEDITVNISAIDPYIKEAFCWSDGNGWNAWTLISMRPHYLSLHSTKTSAVLSADLLVLWITKITQTYLIHQRYALGKRFSVSYSYRNASQMDLFGCFVFSMQTSSCSQENLHLPHFQGRGILAFPKALSLDQYTWWFSLSAWQWIWKRSLRWSRLWSHWKKRSFFEVIFHGVVPNRLFSWLDHVINSP